MQKNNWYSIDVLFKQYQFILTVAFLDKGGEQTGWS